MGYFGVLWGTLGCSPPQELEKAREAGYFSSVLIFVVFKIADIFRICEMTVKTKCFTNDHESYGHNMWSISKKIGKY